MVIEASLPEDVLAGINRSTHTCTIQAFTQEVLTAAHGSCNEDSMAVLRLALVSVSVGVCPSGHESVALDDIREQPFHKGSYPREAIAPLLTLAQIRFMYAQEAGIESSFTLNMNDALLAVNEWTGCRERVVGGNFRYQLLHRAVLTLLFRLAVKAVLLCSQGFEVLAVIGE